MTTPALCQTHPEAAAELGLLAIFRACEANRARAEAARQAREAGRTAGKRFWWQDEPAQDTVHDSTDTDHA